MRTVCSLVTDYFERSSCRLAHVSLFSKSLWVITSYWLPFCYRTAIHGRNTSFMSKKMKVLQELFTSLLRRNSSWQYLPLPCCIAWLWTCPRPSAVCSSYSSTDSQSVMSGFMSTLMLFWTFSHFAIIVDLTMFKFYCCHLNSAFLHGCLSPLLKKHVWLPSAACM